MVNSDSLKIDTVSIVPRSFYINNISDSDYTLDYVRAILYWRKRLVFDTVTITYRVFPFALSSRSLTMLWHLASMLGIKSGECGGPK